MVWECNIDTGERMIVSVGATTVDFGFDRGNPHTAHGYAQPFDAFLTNGRAFVRRHLGDEAVREIEAEIARKRASGR